MKIFILSNLLLITVSFITPALAGKKACTKAIQDLGQYQIFVSTSYDWYVASKKDGKNIRVLYEGHEEAPARKAILEDLGFDIPLVEREMASGGYQPIASDWNAAPKPKANKPKYQTSGRVFVPIAVAELKAKIEAAWDADESGGERNGGTLRWLTKAVAKDLDKVRFDTENIDWETSYNGAVVGYNTLPNGLSYLGVTAGGDWESPIFFIIYWDGEKLRGYIPKDGNPWNNKTHAAYGNDEEKDLEDLKERFKTQLANIKAEEQDQAVNAVLQRGVPADWTKIQADIERRIVQKQ